MSLKYAILGMLSEGPRHGYELKGLCDEAVVPSAKLNFGQVYPTLDRLRRDGCVEQDVVKPRARATLAWVRRPRHAGGIRRGLRRNSDRSNAKRDVHLHHADGHGPDARGLCFGCSHGPRSALARGPMAAAAGSGNHCVTMNVLEQTRELGVLRAVAMKRRRVCKIILAQALAIGVISTLPGVLLGAFLGYAVSNATHAIVALHIPYVLEPGLLIGGVVLALVVAVLASLPPARRAGRLRIIRALQYE